ncbi:DUF998 domain-containing protein [Limosilactobacillus sp.]|uniref:DUF998 domain-containing protein n=1 Tax=Limosilactobacillus sp. TaxID=2773925 RepID=UPI00345E40E9
MEKAERAELKISESAARKLNIDKDTQLSMVVNHHSIIVHPAQLVDQLPDVRLRWFIIPAVILTIVFFVVCQVNHMRLVPLNGDRSIALASMILGIVSGTIEFATSFIWQKVRRTGPCSDFYWRSLPPLLIACGMILAFWFVASFWLIGQIFHGAIFDLYTSTVFVFIILAAVNYLMLNLAMTLSPGIVTNLMTIMIIGGVLSSMLTNSRRNWWRYNFSFLGTDRNAGHWQFNITLVFSALLMITLVDYLFINLDRKYSGRGVLFLRILLYGQALTLAAIGIFPNNPRFHILHDRISMWLVYFILIMILFIDRLLPECTPQFRRLSYVMGGVMAADYIVFKVTNYLSLTAFELLAFALALSWILLLFQNIEAITEYGENIFPLKIVVGEEKSKDSPHSQSHQ